MDAKVYLKNYARKADVFSKAFFKKKKTSAKKIDKNLEEVLQVFENYTFGGKKVRGALTVLGYQIGGGKKLKDILPVSVAIEIFHNFLLIHDDIIDKDKKRRGKDTIHALYAKKYGEDYGNSKAIVVGEIGSFLAYELMVDAKFPREKKVNAMQMLNDYLLKTGYGQLLDIDYDFKKNVSWDEILKVRTYKTAYYTFAMPLSVGLSFSRGNRRKQKGIEKYSINVGIAFQLMDDVLGVFGESKKTGKSTESDIYEGKKTLLYAKALQLADKKDKAFLLRWYGNKKLDSKKVKRIKEIIKKSGSFDFSLDRAKKLTEAGKRYISDITSNKEYAEVLSSLADFVVERDK